VKSIRARGRRIGAQQDARLAQSAKRKTGLRTRLLEPCNAPMSAARPGLERVCAKVSGVSHAGDAQVLDLVRA
jgi:hypothetical protein